MAKDYIFLQFFIIFVILSPEVQVFEVDQNGYLAYCPCMGMYRIENKLISKKKI